MHFLKIVYLINNLKTALEGSLVLKYGDFKNR